MVIKMKPTVYLSYMDYILTIWEEKSFTRAAEKLYISQPALSMIVKKIENEIGYPVFAREGKQVVPTEIGETYIKAIGRIKKIQDELEIELDEILKLKSGRITIGTTTIISSNILPKYVKKFKDKHVNVQISILVGNSFELWEMLEDGSVDIVIDNVLNFDGGFKYTPFFAEKILLGIPNVNPVNTELSEYAICGDEIKRGEVDYEKAPKLSLSGLGDEKFILVKRGNEMRRIATHIFDENGIIPEVSMEFDRPNTAVSYSEVGLGICFLTDTIVRHTDVADNLTLYIPDTAYTETTVYIAYQSKNYISNAQREFLEFMEDELKQSD